MSAAVVRCGRRRASDVGGGLASNPQQCVGAVVCRGSGVKVGNAVV